MDTNRLPQPEPLAQLLTRGPAALFLDFDGTLVEIASGPDAIKVKPGLNAALRILSGRLEGRLALVSGRSIEDIEKHLGPLPLAVAGSHGAAIRSADGEPLGKRAQGIPDDARITLREYAALHGLDVEEKPHGAALHFRSKPEFEEQANDYVRLIALRHDLTTKRGKCVVELVEKGRDKGSAVDTLRESQPFAGATPFFIGDDITDEDGFAACQRLGGAGILVGERGESSADFALRSVADVHLWLELNFDPT